MEIRNIKPTNRGKIFAGVVLIILISVCFLVIGWVVDKHTYLTTNDAKITGDILKVGPRLVGKIAEIKVKEGDVVKKGDLLFTLEADQLAVRVKKATAALEVAEARLDRAVGGSRSQEITGAQSQVDEASATYNGALSGKKSLENNLSTAQNTYSILKKQMEGFKNPKDKLLELNYAMKQLNIKYVSKKLTDAEYTIQAQGILQMFISKAQLEGQIAQMKYQIKSLSSSASASKAGLIGATSRLKLVAEGTSTKDIAILVNTVKAAKATLELSLLSLSFASIKAPGDGTIVRINSHTSEMVSPGVAVMSLVNLEKLNATAYVPEDNLEDVKDGQLVKLSIDSFPGKYFEGKVSKIGLATASVFSISGSDNFSKKYTKVSQRIPVTIDFNYKGTHLIPGMSVYAKIKY
jgi:membrane fusion protein, multidrug efflux system